LIAGKQRVGFEPVKGSREASSEGMKLNDPFFSANQKYPGRPGYFDCGKIKRGIRTRNCRLILQVWTLKIIMIKYIEEISSVGKLTPLFIWRLNNEK